MPIQHTNRRGDVYFLHQGKTKTGKLKWHFSKTATGDLVNVIPDGYDVYESPNAQVFLRKQQPKLIRDGEIALVEKGVRDKARLAYSIVEAKGKDIVVYLADQDTDFLETGLPAVLGLRPTMSPASMHRFLSYSPMMRFELIDEKHREFTAYRWCFLGSIDDWFPLSGQGSLTQLVDKFVRHLGKDSFFELM